jgi:hypothetical protein
VGKYIRDAGLYPQLAGHDVWLPVVKPEFMIGNFWHIFTNLAGGFLTDGLGLP